MKCHFCGNAILNPVFNSNHVIHHLNGNNQDNREENCVHAHRSCHSTYHAVKRAKFPYALIINKPKWIAKHIEIPQNIAQFCEKHDKGDNP